MPIANTMEYITDITVSPLLSHANIKVCYVGQDPNRNGTVITKEVAQEMGRNLPGSPVVGFYNDREKDFEGHNKELILEEGNVKFVDLTKPYGFVPTNAKVWFQTFNDDGVEHEYLCTECWIWTKAFPESQRIIDQGNNQSMELDREKSTGFWANDGNTGKRIFIYNEALIEKLCILGEEVEPCFEGASIKSQFALEFNELKNAMYSLIGEIQETLNKGGSHMEEEKKELEQQGSAVEKFEKKPEEKEEETIPEGKEDKKKEEEDKKKYNLEEVTEYAELQNQYSELNTKFENLQAENTALQAEVESLKTFKLEAERVAKQNMIDSFYMLSADDKKEVLDNIDSYSVDDIEAKLSVICVRNKVNFNLEESKSDEGNQDKNPGGLFNLENEALDNSVPAWIKAVRATESK